MRVLVTGTAGFIGMHVALRLLERGDEVWGVDNFNDYYAVALKRARAARLSAFKKFTPIEADIADLAAMAKAFAAARPERVCHLAAQAGVRHSLVNPFVYETTNGLGTLHMFELAKRNSVPRVVYASSSSVYGGNQKLPFAETDPVNQPISLYAATKRANELTAHAYSHLFGLQTIGLRFFTAYGPWGRPDMAMWLFTKAILAGEPIRIFNHGDMRRDFTYIDDIVSGVVASLDRANLPACIVMNLGNHRSEPLLGLIEILEDHLGKKAIRELLPMQPGDVQASFADITLAQQMLGFQPTTTIREGVPRFLAWYQAHPELTALA